mgnify:CR=1 FL=1
MVSFYISDKGVEHLFCDLVNTIVVISIFGSVQTVDSYLSKPAKSAFNASLIWDNVYFRSSNTSFLIAAMESA